VGGHVGQESGLEQSDHDEPDRLVAVAGRGVHGRLPRRARLLLHSPHRSERLAGQTRRRLQRVARVPATILEKKKTLIQ
jgi:hypothetical protein